MEESGESQLIKVLPNQLYQSQSKRKSKELLK